MRLRRFVLLFAVAAVLVHAAMVVRHGVAMVLAKANHADLVAALSVICHGDSGVSKLAPSDLPDLPQPGKAGDCPVCMGLAAAAAIIPENVLPNHQPLPLAKRLTVVAQQIALRMADARPPPRGPPSLI